MWGILVLQCDFGLPTKVVLPTWQMTLTIPLVSENYPFDGLLASDTTGTIQVYGDSVDTDGDGIMDILLPDTLADYPGGLYITLENDLPPITLPDDMFVIPGQDPMALGVGPINIGSLLPAVLDSGIHIGPVETVINMTDMGFDYPPYTNDTIPASTCGDPNARRSVTVNFTFGDADTNMNFDQDVMLPGYVHAIEVSVASPTDLGGCTACGTIPETFICDDTLFVPAIPAGAEIVIPETILPGIREAYALLPDPATLPPDVPIESFESVKILTGSISSTINSQLPLTSSDLGLLVYTKSAAGRLDTLHNHLFDSISEYMRAGEDSVKISSLDGITLFDSLIFEFGGTINGNNGDTLEFPMGVNPFFHYNFSLDIDGFESFQINMRDTTMAIYQDMNTSSPDAAFSVQIVKATFKDNVDHADTNRLSISLENQMGLDIDVLRIKLRNFYAHQDSLDAGGYEVITFALPDGQTRDTVVVLDGHILSNLTGDDTPLDSLLIETEIQFSSDGGPTTIPYPPPDEMAIDVNVLMTSLRIEDLVGLFDINFGLSDQEQPLSLPGLVGGITFGEAILAITMENEFGVSPGLGLEVKGFRDGDSVVVALDPDSVNFQSGSPDLPVSTEIRISREYVRRTVAGDATIVQHFPADNNIVNLMAMMPDIVSVGGDASISPNGLTSITAGAEISGTWRFEIPFYLSIATGGVEFMPPTFSKMAALDSSTIRQLVGANGVPDDSDMLLSSTINTIIFSDIGLGFGLEILVSDIQYFPFYSSLENRVLVSADLDDDGSADTLDLNLDTLIMHPLVKTLQLEIPAGIADPSTGLVIPGMEGSGQFSYSADFNLTDMEGDSTYGTLKHKKYAFLDTFMLARSDSGFADVASALAFVELDAPTVPDSLYNLTLNSSGTELWLIQDVTAYGELGWLVESKDHYIATKFILEETPNPALLPFSAGIDVTAFMQFILNSGPMFSSAEEDTTQ
ncbi:MAG: hypothetical protein HON27_03620 [Candidatus Marinimicrobia bacterium]|nr:hypothetical protein [Candidatus Neomarinimicrobiota bacterium]MBT4945240.1 hypothetical protein [Candidatus Neomarinimicrobiota bacterium]